MKLIIKAKPLKFECISGDYILAEGVRSQFTIQPKFNDSLSTIYIANVRCASKTISFQTLQEALNWCEAENQVAFDQWIEKNSDIPSDSLVTL